jgi:hypothetical protein
MSMPLKNRRVTQAKKIVIPVKKKSLKNQILVIRGDLKKLGNDVASGYEIFKELILHQFNKKLMRKFAPSQGK